MQTRLKAPLIQALCWSLTFYEVPNMFDFLKKRREAEQQRKFDQLLRAQEEFLALYESITPASQADELKAVAASFEQGRRNDSA